MPCGPWRRRRGRGAARRGSSRTATAGAGESPALPTAATTSAPFLCAYAIASASSGEYVSRSASDGSRRPPKLRLITRAPESAAQRMARTSASSGIPPSGATTLATTSRADSAMPAMPSPFSTLAAISPATNVPCPDSSRVARPPTKDRVATMRPARSAMSGVDARVDHRDADGGQHGRQRPAVEGVRRDEVPLARGERVRRRERGRSAGGCRARQAPPRRGMRPRALSSSANEGGADSPTA